MKTKAEDIATLVEMFDGSDWDELHVEIDGVQLFLSKDPNARLAAAAAPLPAPQPAAAPAPSASPAAAPAPSPATAAIPSHWVAVKAPHLATFYRAPKPGAAPLVELGTAVTADTEICLLEVMKLYTVLKAGVAGIVRKLCVNDAELVEFGQVLLYIEPA